ncbi:MAG: hypothetical protein U5P41_09210 [Gammaproteobacteria bacterium]|nr:hypothetical protein [Gammaproteobacteria bacterium]
MTSVHILDDKTLAACHFAGKSMFLVSFDINTAEYEILDRIDTTVDGVPVCTDLMHGLGDMLVTSNFHKGTQSFYEVAGGGIHHRRDIKPPNGYTKCHGVRFIPEDYGVSSLLATTFNSKSNPSILFMAIDTGAIHCELKIKDTLPFWLRRRNILPRICTLSVTACWFRAGPIISVKSQAVIAIIMRNIQCCSTRSI